MVITLNRSQVHRLFSALAVVLAVATFGQRTAAQGLTSSLFERYLESLREQAGIPGMSALVLQDGVVIWERGFGRADLESGERAEPYTPYLIGDISQTFGATLLLKKCIEESFATLNDPLAAWVPGSVEPATLAQLLAHISPTGSFKFDRGRFAALTPVIEACSGRTYRQLLDDEIFVRLGMVDSAPGTAMAAPTPQDLELFDAGRLEYLGAVLRRLATPYSADARGRMVRTPLTPAGVDASLGIVSSARDLARFDRVLGPGDDFLQPEARLAAWTRPVADLPSGLGWFVQNYNGQAVVWQFGVVPDAYSSLIIKLKTAMSPPRSLRGCSSASTSLDAVRPPPHYPVLRARPVCVGSRRAGGLAGDAVSRQDLRRQNHAARSRARC